MYMLVILIFVMTANQLIIGGANDMCGPLDSIPETEPVTGKYALNSPIRIQCIAGYVRKAGTSNMYRCLKENDEDKPSWKPTLSLVCIPDPKKKKAPTPRSNQHFTSTTTEINTPTISGSSTPTTATGYKTLTTTTNEVFTTNARTTNQPTLKSTTKEAESITSTNAITASSTASSITSRQNKSTTSPQTKSSSFTTTTGGSVEGVKSPFGSYTSTIGAVTSILILCLAATVFILWRRSRRRNYTNVIILHQTNPDAADSDLPDSVIAPKPNIASTDSTAVCCGTNQPQADSVQDSDSIHL